MKSNEFRELFSYNKLSLYITLIYFIIAFFLSSFLEVPVHNDSWSYLKQAKQLANGKGYDYPFQPPGFPFFISIFEKYFHIDGFYAGTMISIIFSAIFIYIVYIFVKILFDDDKIAFYSQLLVASNTIVISWSIVPVTEMMFVAFFYISIYLILKSFNKFSYFPYIFSGIFAGLSYLTRTIGIVLLITIPILILSLYNIKIKNRLVLIFIYILCFLGITSPWLIYNYVNNGSPFYNKTYIDIAFMIYGDGNWSRFYEFGDLYHSLTEVILSNPTLFILHWLKVSIIGIYFMGWVFNPIVGFMLIFSISKLLFNIHGHLNRKLLFVSSILFFYYFMIAISHFEFRFFIPIIPLAMGIVVYGCLTKQEQGDKFKISNDFLNDNSKIFNLKVKEIILILIILLNIIFLPFYPIDYSGLSVMKLVQSQHLEYKEAGIFLRNIGNSSETVMGHLFYSYYTNMTSTDFIPDSLSNIKNIDYLIYDERFFSVERPQFRFLLDPSNKSVPSNFKLIYNRYKFPKIVIYRIMNENNSMRSSFRN